MLQTAAGEILVDQLNNLLGKSPDFNCKPLKINECTVIFCIYIDSIVKTDQMDELIIKPIIESSHTYDPKMENVISFLKSNVPFLQSEECSGLKQSVDALLDGHCLLVPVLGDECLSFAIHNNAYRSVSEPQTEAVIRGPREGFVEDSSKNIALIRKRLKSEHLVFEQFVIGTETRCKVFITYLDHVAAEQTVYEFRQRLLAIQTDGILESANIEEWIQDKTLTPFPQIISTERPDAIVGKLLEGQVAVLTDGTPMVLVGPITFFQLFTSPEDYYQRADIATMLRWLRMFAFLLSIFVPSLYISVVSYHPELLPTPLLITIAAQREDVPFPALMEATIMMVTFEILREAGLRMPRIVGQTISIVGALVLGQAAVEAGIVSAAMVIVVSLTAISNFISPTYSFGITQRIIQFSFMMLSGLLGLFGLICGVFFLIVHLVSIRSFGTKYFTPLAPVVLSDWKDTFVRVPHFLKKQSSYGVNVKKRR